MTTVAIDGPAGAGKSTVAKEVAAAIGFDYLDTGAMYRAVALVSERKGIDAKDGAALGELASGLDIELGERVIVDGEDVTEAIRTEAISRTVSAIAVHPEVRTRMADLQREIAARGDVVIEGRDIGSNVLPQAEVKIFLTASVDERARRRAAQVGKSDPADIENIKKAITARDENDSQRSASPLIKAADATEVDSTGKGVSRVVEEIVAIVSAELGLE